jgi:hypothetical protein
VFDETFAIVREFDFCNASGDSGCIGGLFFKIIDFSIIFLLLVFGSIFVAL